MKIFLSSTYKDLVEHRRTVIGVIERLQHTGFDIEWLGMERWPARNAPSVRVCKDCVDQCDVYVGIFGVRYGSFDSKTGLSYTEIEYRRAVRKRKKRLIFLIDENNAKFSFTEFEHNFQAQEKRAKLIEDLKKDRLVAFFTTPEDLAGKVNDALFSELSVVSRRSQVIDQLIKGLNLLSPLMSEAVRWKTTYQFALQGWLGIVLEAFNSAQMGFLYLCDGETGMLKMQATACRPPVVPTTIGQPFSSEELARNVYQSGKSHIVHNAASDPLYGPITSTPSLKVHAAIAIPLLGGVSTVGVLCLENMQLNDAFDDEDEQLLKLFAGQLAFWQENVSLLQTRRSALPSERVPRVQSSSVRLGKRTKH